MKITQFTEFLFAGAVALTAMTGRAQWTYTDDFSKAHDYLTNGVAGTMWDGVYLGAGSFTSPMSTGMAPGTVSVAAASNGVLHVASLQTDWEEKADDGFFLFKVITGDFDMSVEVVGPINHNAHNFPGMMVRAFHDGGAPAPEAKENYFIWGRFDEYNIPNMLKNNVNAVKKDTSLGTWPNSNYWLRIERSSNTFRLSEKAAAGDAWKQAGSVTRADFGVRPLQVGIEHADYDGGRTLPAVYRNFSLTLSNMGPFVAAPEPPVVARTTTMYLPLEPNQIPAEPDRIAAASNKVAVVSWLPGKGSSGTLVLAWSGSPVLRTAPVNGVTYRANGNFALGETLPADNYFVASTVAPMSASVLQLPLRKPCYAALFSYTGSGKTITYSHDAVIVQLQDGKPD